MFFRSSFLLLLVFIATMSVGCSCMKSSDCSPGATSCQIAPSDGVLIHLTAGQEDPHRVLMALKMANLMHEGGKNVLVYCDIKAVEVLVTGSDDLTVEPFPSLHAQLKSLSEAGVKVMACPGCLKAAGLSPDQLVEGVTVAEKDTFFNFTSGRILTLDY